MKAKGKNPESGRPKPSRLTVALGATLAAAVLIIAGVIAYHKIYYSERWYKNTIINDVDVSGMTLEESRQNLIDAHRDYRLTILGRNGGEAVVDGADIDYVFNIGTDFDDLFQKQHSRFQLFAARNQYAVNYDVSYDSDKLSGLLGQSVLLAGSGDYPITAPQSASVAFSEEKQQYVCVEEVNGNTLAYARFLDAVEASLRKAAKVLDTTDAEAYPDIYKKPAITSDDEELQSALALSNQAALRYIVWNMGNGVKEQITPSEISQWITYKNGRIKYDNDALADWIETFCLKYKTVGKTRTITSHTGKPVKIVGGDYGWQLDYEKTLAQAKKALREPLASEAIDAYIQDPTASNRKALTLKRKVIYANTAYQMDYENPTNDWDHKNYIEISIKAQKVYVFRKGKVKFSCRCITGLPVEGRSTPTGAYFIKEHREQYTLTGSDYSTPVTNWVRITWTGTGFHPATWQPWSSWTKDLYKTRGSHGCINLSVPDAAKIYQLTKYREAVFIH